MFNSSLEVQDHCFAFSVTMFNSIENMRRLARVYLRTIQFIASNVFLLRRLFTVVRLIVAQAT